MKHSKKKREGAVHKIARELKANAAAARKMVMGRTFSGTDILDAIDAAADAAALCNICSMKFERRVENFVKATFCAPCQAAILACLMKQREQRQKIADKYRRKAQ